MKILFSSLITILLLICISDGPARGAWRHFIPRYVDYSGNLGIESLYEKNTVSSEDNSRKQSDFTVQEGLGLQGLGYIYSPLFISMQTSLSLGLQQERLRKDGDTASTKGDANQFKQVFKFLPAHPYNMELYGLRSRPLQSGSWGGNSTVVNEYGAKALYDMRPWAFSLTYTNIERRSSNVAEDDSLVFHSNYFDDLSGTSGSTIYHHSFFDVNDNSGNREMYGGTYAKAYASWRFSTRYSHDRDNQESTSASTLRSSSTARQESSNELSINLPLRFRAKLDYTVTEYDVTQTTATRAQTHYSDSERYNYQLHHRLYNSLHTSLRYNHTFNETSGGKSLQESYNFNADYSKKLRWGSLLSGAWSTLSYLDNSGAPETLSENHQIFARPTPDEPKAYSFTLNFQNIDRSTITIYILDKTDPPIRIFLPEDYYEVKDDIPGGLFRITIDQSRLTHTPPPGLSTPIGQAEDYTYQADYAFIPSNYLLRTTSWGGNIQMPFFDSLVTPIYSYSETKQKEMDGIYPGNPEQSTSHTVGVSFKARPFQGAISKNWSRSTRNASERLNAQLNYSSNLTPFTKSFITLQYENATTEDDQISGPDIEVDETFYTVQAQLQTIWPAHNLSGSITGNYSIYDGLGDSTNMSLLSILTWRLGQLSVNLNASYTNSVSEFGDSKTEQSNTVVRFMLTRELF